MKCNWMNIRNHDECIFCWYENNFLANITHNNPTESVKPSFYATVEQHSPTKTLFVFFCILRYVFSALLFIVIFYIQRFQGDTTYSSTHPNQSLWTLDMPDAQLLRDEYAAEYLQWLHLSQSKLTVGICTDLRYKPKSRLDIFSTHIFMDQSRGWIFLALAILSIKVGPGYF
jgi:hypothetical protein